MGRFILYFDTPQVFVAGYKYENDLRQIFVEEGYKDIKYGKSNDNKIKRQIERLLTLFRWGKIFHKNDSVFYIAPMNKWYKMILDINSQIKKFKTYAIITDIDYLRLLNKKEVELKLYKKDSGAIIQNNIMAEALKKEGFCGAIAIQDCLDFLIPVENINDDYLSKSLHENIEICYGGNLSKKKASFIYKLFDIDWNYICFNLYGVNYEKNTQSKSVRYRGYSSPEEIVNLLDGDFGLVWDGDSLEACSGPSGNYYRYACPHKLSQYIACGMPVIVWRQSVMADFVLNNSCGICVDSIFELDDVMRNMSNLQYRKLLFGVKKVRDRIICGYYTKNAIKKLGALNSKEGD